MEGIVGEIRLWANTFPPVSWLFCEGQMLPIAEYQTLFVVIGTTYGGDGVSTFQLPDLRGRVAIGAGAGPGLTPRALGERLGAATVTLTTAQMPAHAHAVPAGSDPANVAAPVGAHPAASETVTPYGSAANALMAGTAVGPVGEGQPHDNMQPYLAVRYVICLEGLFPSRW